MSEGEGGAETEECLECGHEAAPEQTFCTACGARVALTAPEKTYRKKTRYTSRILITIGAIVCYILGSFLLHRWELGLPPLLGDLFFLALALILVRSYKEDLFSSLQSYSFIQKRMLLYLGIQTGLTLGTLYGMDKLEAFLGMEGGDPLGRFDHYQHPYLVALLSVAVFPPITEELSFRGVLFGQISRMSSPWLSIFFTGFLFAWIHFSFISLFWLFPAGIFLGWVRYKEGSVWPCVLLHALHNGAAITWSVWPN